MKRLTPDEYPNLQSGVKKHIFYITTDAMNKKVAEFTKNQRPWTAYPADTIEVIARHYNLIPQNSHYVTFETEQERLKFQVVDQKPRWIENTRSFISRILGK